MAMLGMLTEEHSFSKLRPLLNLCDVPWIILGDFNATEDSQDVAPLFS